MMLFNKTWIAMLMMASVLIIPMQTSASAPSVIISEVAWAGSSLSSSDEWLELTNVSTESVDISGWHLSGAGSGGATITLPEETHLEPYSTYLISNYDQTHENSTLGVESNLVTATLSISNEGFAIHLYDNDDSQIDSAGDGNSPFAGRSGSDQDTDDGQYRSMVRVDRLLDGSLETSWVDAEISIGFINEATDVGTPGSADDWLLSFDEVQEEPEEDLPSYEDNTMIINEFVSDPLEDEEEWIEIQNVSNESVDLTGWTVEDATERQTELGEGSLEPGNYLVIEDPTGQLNNGGDTIILRDPSGNEIDSVAYGTEEVPDPDKGQAMALNNDGVFEVTDSPTPGEENVIEIIEEVEVDEEEEVLEEIVEEGFSLPEDEEVDEEETVTEENVEETDTENEPQDEVETETEEQEEEVVVEEGYTGPTTLVFSELFPNTPGADADEEYIMITNTGTESIDLEGWMVQDETGNLHTFSSGSLDPDAVFTLMRTESGVTLNNDGDALLLQSPDGNLVDYVNYGKANNGAQYVLENGLWAWVEEETETVVTEVVVVDEPSPAAVASTTTTSTPSSSTPSVSYASSASKQTTTYVYVDSLTIAEAKLESDGTEVSLSGVVTVEPDVFGKQIMYIQDLTGGIQVYKHDSDFPDLQVGDLISFTGELSTNRSEKRVKLSSDASITITQGAFVETQYAISEEVVGSLVQVAGLVHSKASSTVTLEESEAEFILYFGSSSDLISDIPARGERIKVTGVLTNSNGELRIRPRSSDDIVVLENETEEVVASAISGKDEYSNMQSTVGWILVLMTAATIGFLALRKYFPTGRKHSPA